MGEWLLSWRDRLIVASHEVPGSDAERSPRPAGTVEVIGSPQIQSSRWDGAIFLMIPGTSCLATIVLSLRDDRAAPPGQKPFAQ
jgi:hypothetical protein